MPAAFSRINYRVLTVFLIVGLVMLAVASVLVIGAGQARLRDAYGLHLAQVADQTAAAVDTYIYRRVISVSSLAYVPTLREVAVAGNRVPADAEQIRAADKEWIAGVVPAALAGVLTNPAAEFLVDMTRMDQIYKEILLTDMQGRLVAASEMTSDYFQGDEDWWREAYADGVHGRLSVSDVRWDESARVFAIEIAVPVPEPNSGRMAGILKVIADIREMATVVGSVRLGTTGEAVLLRQDGTVVFSRQPADPKARFFATDLIREQLQRVTAGDPVPEIFFGARASDGTLRMVGVSQSQLVASYPNLAWLVAVSQADDELFAPVRLQIRDLILVLALTAIAVLLLALFFSMRLVPRPDEAAMHLVEHAKIPRMEDEETEAR